MMKVKVHTEIDNVDMLKFRRLASRLNMSVEDAVRKIYTTGSANFLASKVGATN